MYGASWEPNKTLKHTVLWSLVDNGVSQKTLVITKGSLVRTRSRILSFLVAEVTNWCNNERWTKSKNNAWQPGLLSFSSFKSWGKIWFRSSTSAPINVREIPITNKNNRCVNFKQVLKTFQCQLEHGLCLLIKTRRSVANNETNFIVFTNKIETRQFQIFIFIL